MWAVFHNCPIGLYSRLTYAGEEPVTEAFNGKYYYKDRIRLPLDDDLTAFEDFYRIEYFELKVINGKLTNIFRLPSPMIDQLILRITVGAISVQNIL